MATDLPVASLVELIIGDFRDAWDALAARQGSLHRGNFLFARQAMTLLEVACRLCHSDVKGEALQEFSRELAQRDKRYFTPLPGPCGTYGPEFYLPSQSSGPPSELIFALFDLIRNGQAHQYQQIRARLADGKDFQFSLTGADYGFPLSQTFAQGRPSSHLSAWRDGEGDLWMKVRTDVLFLDICEAFYGAGLLDRGLTFKHLSRPSDGKRKHYQFSSADLESHLQNGGHFQRSSQEV